MTEVESHGEGEMEGTTSLTFEGSTEGFKRILAHFMKLREQGLPFEVEGHKVLEIRTIHDVPENPTPGENC